MENNITFKKSFFGGFDRENVMDYIAEITDEFHKYKKETVLKVEEMKGKISELEKAYNSILEENEKLKAEISDFDAKESAQAEKPDIEKLIGSLTESMNVLISVLSTEDGDEADEEKINEEEISDMKEKSMSESKTKSADFQDEIEDLLNKYS